MYYVLIKLCQNKGITIREEPEDTIIWAIMATILIDNKEHIRKIIILVT